MSVHSKNWWAARLAAETKFASGAGANLFDQTKLAAVVGMAYPRSFGDNMYPYQKKVKDEIVSQDDGIYKGTIVQSGWEGVDGSREEYIQDSFYLDKIIGLLAGQGVVPSSYALHWQDHIRAGSASDNLRYESYGCLVKELSIKIPVNDGTKGSFPYWAVTDFCYSSKYDGEDGTDVDSIVDVPWLPIGANPISTQASFQIKESFAGTFSDVNNLEGELKIPLLYTEDKEAGDDGNKYPYFVGFGEIEFTCTFRNYTQYKEFIINILEDRGSDHDYTIKITSGLAACFPQVTYMMVKEGDLNKIPEKGMVKFNLTFVMGDSSVLSKEAS